MAILRFVFSTCQGGGNVGQSFFIGRPCISLHTFSRLELLTIAHLYMFSKLELRCLICTYLRRVSYMSYMG